MRDSVPDSYNAIDLAFAFKNMGVRVVQYKGDVVYLLRDRFYIFKSDDSFIQIDKSQNNEDALISFDNTFEVSESRISMYLPLKTPLQSDKSKKSAKITIYPLNTLDDSIEDINCKETIAKMDQTLWYHIAKLILLRLDIFILIASLIAFYIQIEHYPILYFAYAIEVDIYKEFGNLKGRIIYLIFSVGTVFILSKASELYIRLVGWILGVSKYNFFKEDLFNK